MREAFCIYNMQKYTYRDLTDIISIYFGIAYQISACVNVFRSLKMGSQVKVAIQKAFISVKLHFY
jgi:hypothetical protein